MSFKKTNIGWEWISEEYIVFYGNKSITLDNIQTHFNNNYEFIKLKQIHSDKLVETQKNVLQEADAHWTKLENTGLLIQTADCLPVFIYDSESKIILGIHAGWRGIVNQIIPKSIKELFDKKSSLHIFIGPSIQFESFEVDDDVADLILNSTQNPNSYFKKINNKFHFDLTEIASQQILETHIPNQIYKLKIDTLTNLELSSYRREKAPCRNWSFILKYK